VELRELLAALRASWWFPLAGMLLFVAAALTLGSAQTPLYSSSTQLFASMTGAASTSEAYLGGQFAQQRVTSYARLVTGVELAGRVIQRLDLKMTPQQLAQEITATAEPETVLLDVTVTDPSAVQASRIADAVGTEFASMVAQLETPAAGGPPPVKVTVTQPPSTPTSPSSPQTSRNVAVGALAGLVLGAGLGVARAKLDLSLKAQDEAAEAASAPVIGVVHRNDLLQRQRTFAPGRSSAAEDFRKLRNNLQFLSLDDPRAAIMVSSAVPREGKTTITANLGMALTEAGRKVTLVDADLRHPQLTRYLGIADGIGLTNVLTGRADLDDVLQAFGQDGLSVISAGPTPPNPGELLGSESMASLLEKLRVQNDFVLVDAPPILPVADPSGLAVHMDGVLLCTRYGSTTEEQLRQAAVAVARAGGKTLGVVLTMVPPKATLAHAYGWGLDVEHARNRSSRKSWRRRTGAHHGSTSAARQ
jgi:capsular exopolysaccharide synthesis family protein